MKPWELKGFCGTIGLEQDFLDGLVQTHSLENDMANQNNPSGQKDQQQKHQNQPQSGQQSGQQQRQAGQQGQPGQQSGQQSGQSGQIDRDQQNKQR